MDVRFERYDDARGEWIPVIYSTAIIGSPAAQYAAALQTGEDLFVAQGSVRVSRRMRRRAGDVSEEFTGWVYRDSDGTAQLVTGDVASA